MLRRSCRRRGASFEQQRVEAPTPGPVKHHEEKHPAIKNRDLAMIRTLLIASRDRKKLCHWCRGSWDVDRKISVGKRPAADERGEAGEQAKGNHESANEHDPSAQLRLKVLRARHPAKHSQDQLPA